MYRIGTCNYRSLIDLQKHYQYDWENALKEGRVSIGKPSLKAGEKLLVDSNGRYHIEVNEENK